MRHRRLSHTTFRASAGLVIALTSLPTAAVYNSEEHKLIVDRGASMVSQPPLVILPAPTRFVTLTPAAVVGGYKAAKHLAVGIESNNPTEYSEETRKVQDNSYWTGTGFAQRAGNLNIYIPSEAEVATRVLVVTAWDGAQYIAFTFGELVALYGDYRRTVYCEGGGKCYLTNRDDPQYENQSGTRNPGTIYFEWGQDCFGPLNLDCGWRPDPVPTNTYLRAIASGVWPPYGGFGNQVANTANYQEELDAGWWGDEMIRIANVNDWHFSQAAVAWYIGMHRLALAYARLGGVYWNRALHYEASALHSLTDLFAFGHVVTSRDRTSYAIMTAAGLLNDPNFVWMESVRAMGGGSRQTNGAVTLTTNLPTPLSEATNTRDDFMASYRGNGDNALKAKIEHDIHDTNNTRGAVVVNLKRQEFTIFGDGRLRLSPPAQAIIAEAVRSSLQSLFDAAVSGAPIADITKVGSSYFDALLNIPVFVKAHPGAQFDGEWTRYAIAVDSITNAGFVPPDAAACVMPFVDGGTPTYPPLSEPCMRLDRPTGTSIVTQLLNMKGLGRGDQLGLDALGNRNGGFDVGDFLAWVKANHATPEAAARVPAVPQKGGRP